MAAEAGDADAHGTDLAVGVHDFLRLVVHLHLLLRVAVVAEDVNLRNHVESQLIGELLDGGLLAGKYLAVLFVEFCHCRCSGTAGSLIAGYVNALDVRQVLQGLQGHDHHDGGAVGVGYDASRTVECILGVAFGHHEGHILVHAEGAGVVYHHGSVLCDGVGKLLACAASGTGEGNIDALEVVVMLQEFHFYLLAPECVFTPCATLAAKEEQFVNGEISLVKHSQEFLPYGTTGAYNSHSHC